MDTPLFNLTLTGTVSPAFDSPLATAPIRPSREFDTQEKYRQGEDKTARLPRMAKYFPDIGGLAYVPYFPAAGIRGALRRAARDVMLESIQNDTWGLELHRLLTIGGVGASGPFAKSPFLGAHHAQGCGIVEASWEVSLGGMAGTLEIKPFMGLVVNGDPLSECLDTAKAAFRQAMAGCTEDSLLPS